MDLKKKVQKLFSIHATPLFSERFARYLLLRTTPDSVSVREGRRRRQAQQERRRRPAPPPTWAPRVNPGTACHVVLLPRPPAPKRSRAEMSKPPSPVAFASPPTTTTPPHLLRLLCFAIHPPVAAGVTSLHRVPARRRAPSHRPTSPTARRWRTRDSDPCSGSSGSRVLVVSSSSAASAVLSLPLDSKVLFAFRIRPFHGSPHPPRLDCGRRPTPRPHLPYLVRGIFQHSLACEHLSSSFPVFPSHGSGGWRSETSSWRKPCFVSCLGSSISVSLERRLAVLSVYTSSLPDRFSSILHLSSPQI